MTLKSEKKHNIFYRTTNQINWKYYFGIHSTDNLDDGYLGSGTPIRRAIKKHGRENFVRTVIADYQTRKEANEHERLAVTVTQVEDQKCYNARTGGDNEYILSDESRKIISMKNKGRKHSEETKIKIREGQQKAMPETRKKISKANKGRKPSPESIQKIKDALTGRKQSKEVVEAKSKRLTGQFTDKQRASLLTRKKVSQDGENNPQFGKIWVKNPNTKESKSITAEELESYLNSGWTPGRIFSDKHKEALCTYPYPTVRCYVDGKLFEAIKDIGIFYEISRNIVNYRLNSDKWSTWIKIIPGSEDVDENK